MDVHGDALGVAFLPGDRWRRAHDILKDQVYVDGRALGINLQKEVYGLFSRYHSAEGREEYEKLSNRDPRPQKIVPDLKSSNHIEVSVLQTTVSKFTRSSACSQS